MKHQILSSIIVCVLFAACIAHKQEWQRLTTGFNNDFHDIAIIDKNTAIAYSYGSGLIIKTEDRGRSWRIAHSNDSIYFEQIQFPSPNIGFICGNSNKILKTTDVGESWLEIPIDTLPETAPIYGMCFPSTEIGYISVLNRTSEGYKTNIYKTTNSGDSWTKINTIPEMILNLEETDNEIWGSGHNVVIKNIEKESWETVYKDTTKQVGQIRDIIVQDEKLILCSFNGFIIIKQENTLTKQQITTNRLRSILSINGKKLFVAGDNNKEEGNLFESSDSGKTWIKAETKFNDIHRLKLKDGIIWGAGKNDEIIRLELFP